jgi:hypothetical protein
MPLSPESKHSKTSRDDKADSESECESGDRHRSIVGPFSTSWSDCGVDDGYQSCVIDLIDARCLELALQCKEQILI